MRDRLELKDGWLCVRTEIIGTHKPTRTVVWYPSVRMLKGIFDDLELGSAEVREAPFSGEYHAYVRDFPGKLIQLKDLGATKPIAHETHTIPCPKVRKGIETRWSYGEWQKLLKKGWVSAF